MVDAVEIRNGKGTERENAFSSEIAGALGLPGTGASDAHRIEDLGTFATEFQRPVLGLDDFIAELKAGRFAPVAVREPAVRLLT